MSSSSLVDLWSVVSGLSMGGLFVYLLLNYGCTLHVNVNHHFIEEVKEEDDDATSVELEVVEYEGEEGEEGEEEVLEDNEVVENEKDD